MATKFEEAEFKFPDEQKEEPKQETPSIEIEIEDDTPEEDRDKQPLPQNLKEELEKANWDQEMFNPHI